LCSFSFPFSSELSKSSFLPLIFSSLIVTGPHYSFGPFIVGFFLFSSFLAACRGTTLDTPACSAVLLSSPLYSLRVSPPQSSNLPLLPPTVDVPTSRVVFNASRWLQDEPEPSLVPWFPFLTCSSLFLFTVFSAPTSRHPNSSSLLSCFLDDSRGHRGRQTSRIPYGFGCHTGPDLSRASLSLLFANVSLLSCQVKANRFF